MLSGNVFFTNYYKRTMTMTFLPLEIPPFRFLGPLEIEPPSNDVEDGDYFVLSGTGKTLTLQYGKWVEIFLFRGKWMKVMYANTII